MAGFELSRHILRLLAIGRISDDVPRRQLRMTVYSWLVQSLRIRQIRAQWGQSAKQ
jgi:hypothetical protein